MAKISRKTSFIIANKRNSLIFHYNVMILRHSQFVVLRSNVVTNDFRWKPKKNAPSNHWRQSVLAGPKQVISQNLFIIVLIEILCNPHFKLFREWKKKLVSRQMAVSIHLKNVWNTDWEHGKIVVECWWTSNDQHGIIVKQAKIRIDSVIILILLAFLILGRHLTEFSLIYTAEYSNRIDHIYQIESMQKKINKFHLQLKWSEQKMLIFCIIFLRFESKGLKSTTSNSNKRQFIN